MIEAPARGAAHRTLRRAARVQGRGLFSGRPVTLRLLPGRSGWRWGTCPASLRPLLPAHLSPLPHRSRLVDGEQRVVLPEHALAALVLLDVDAVDLVFEGGEAPIVDGSALPFLWAVLAAGLRGRPRSRLRVEAGTIRWSGGPWPARARTFLRRPDASRLRPLFPGARPGAAVVLDGGGALYGGRPRLPDEPAVHKLLDLLGDLGPWRARGPLRGHLLVPTPRHEGNPAAIAAAFADGTLRWS